MRKAYGGRAAAFERRRDFDRAAADYGMIVFSYAVELDIADPKADGYGDLLRDAAKAYRVRAACLEAKGADDGATRDRRRADGLEAKAKSAVAKAPEPAAPLSGRVTLRNDWTDPLTVVIAGASYTLAVGETKTVPSPIGSFPYELQAGGNQAQGTLESGKSYSLGVHKQTPP